MKTIIITDDNSGISKKEAENLGIKILRMPIIIDGVCYFENENISSEEFYKYLNQDCDVKTSQPSPGEVVNFWENTLKECDAIIHIPMSSGLSESCHTALMLSEDFKDKVYVVDNHRISVTLKSSVYDAIKLVNSGKNPAEVKDILENTKYDSSIYIMVDTLKFLKKGGRVTAAGAALGATFHIKPVLTIQGGKLDAFAKCTGLKRSKLKMLSAIEDELENKFKDVPLDQLRFAVAYTYDEEAASLWKTEIEEYFHVNVEDMDELSLSVASHIGPGALAIAVSKKVQ